MPPAAARALAVLVALAGASAAAAAGPDELGLNKLFHYARRARKLEYPLDQTWYVASRYGMDDIFFKQVYAPAGLPDIGSMPAVSLDRDRAAYARRHADVAPESTDPVRGHWIDGRPVAVPAGKDPFVALAALWLDGDRSDPARWAAWMALRQSGEWLAARRSWMLDQSSLAADVLSAALVVGDGDGDLLAVWSGQQFSNAAAAHRHAAAHAHLAAAALSVRARSTDFIGSDPNHPLVKMQVLRAPNQGRRAIHVPPAGGADWPQLFDALWANWDEYRGVLLRRSVVGTVPDGEPLHLVVPLRSRDGPSDAQLAAFLKAIALYSARPAVVHVAVDAQSRAQLDRVAHQTPLSLLTRWVRIDAIAVEPLAPLLRVASDFDETADPMTHFPFQYLPLILDELLAAAGGPAPDAVVYVEPTLLFLDDPAAMLDELRAAADQLEGTVLGAPRLGLRDQCGDGAVPVMAINMTRAREINFGALLIVTVASCRPQEPLLDFARILHTAAPYYPDRFVRLSCAWARSQCACEDGAPLRTLPTSELADWDRVFVQFFADL